MCHFRKWGSTYPILKFIETKKTVTFPKPRLNRDRNAFAHSQIKFDDKIGTITINLLNNAMRFTTSHISFYGR